jgi:S1-C subfamily serine protease
MLSPEWLSAFARVGSLRGRDSWAAHGAGVFFHKPPVLWLVTANHVVENVGPELVSVLVTQSGGGKVVVVPVGQLVSQHQLGWIRDPINDLAAAPMPTAAEFGIKALTEQYCICLRELIPSMPCFTIGCPYGLHGLDPTRASPLVLDGVIAGVDLHGRRVFTNAPTFRGNSGGPLIAVRSPFSPDGAMSVGRPTVLLAGVMLRSLLVPDPTPNSTEPRLHLGVAAPADTVIELLESERAQALVSRLLPH